MLSQSRRNSSEYIIEKAGSILWHLSKVTLKGLMWTVPDEE
jgi:hypothetical protein